MADYERLSKVDFVNNARYYTANTGRDDCWGSHRLKNFNYVQMLSINSEGDVPLSQASCLDVGCGTGDLSFLLNSIGIKSYLGVDIFRNHLDVARHKYPREQFLLADILTGSINGKFDYVFCSGALTGVSHADNYDYIGAMITKMWELSRVGVAFNVLTPDEDGIYSEGAFLRTFLYDPQKVLSICQQVTGAQRILYFQDNLEDQAHFHILRRGSQLPSSPKWKLFQSELS